MIAPVVKDLKRGKEMEKEHTRELKRIIVIALEAHKMANYDDAGARSVIAGVMVSRFDKYMNSKELKLKDKE